MEYNTYTRNVHVDTIVGRKVTILPAARQQGSLKEHAYTYTRVQVCPMCAQVWNVWLRVRSNRRTREPDYEKLYKTLYVYICVMCVYLYTYLCIYIFIIATVALNQELCSSLFFISSRSIFNILYIVKIVTIKIIAKLNRKLPTFYL